MKAVILMFDSLNRHQLSPYGDTDIETPNFARLARHTTTFEKFYAGSMPCMPARRELHTGRYNFLHRSWGPLEPFDHSMPEQLSRAGIHTHLTTDHPHYWEDGGATYHTRYTTWEFHRGQEGDPWKGEVSSGTAGNKSLKTQLKRQDAVNRRYMPNEQTHCQTRTVDSGLDFIDTNAKENDWLLQIELFDPHEPFFSPENYRKRQGLTKDDRFDWPGYHKVSEPKSQVNEARSAYAALLTMCDYSLGRILDAFDEHNLWQDTLLIVNTDHGYLLGQHGWWAKGVMPWYNELVHLPVFLWDPRSGKMGVRSDELAQTIDIAPTILAFFGLPIPEEVQGHDLAPQSDVVRKEGALFGRHGAHVNVTDGRYVYMRSPIVKENHPLEEYTLMPTHMRSRFATEELYNWEKSDPLPFTRGISVMKIDVNPRVPFPFSSGWSGWNHGTLLFDLLNDPLQIHPLRDDELELKMATLLVKLMHDSNAPQSQFERLGLPSQGPPHRDHLLIRAQIERSKAIVEPLPEISKLPGQYWLQQPIEALLHSKNLCELLLQVVPELALVEQVTILPGTTVVDLATSGTITSQQLKEIAALLAQESDPR